MLPVVLFFWPVFMLYKRYNVTFKNIDVCQLCCYVLRDNVVNVVKKQKEKKLRKKKGVVSAGSYKNLLLCVHV
jgi:hypothetical protein